MHESTTRLAGEVVDDLTSFLDAARGTGVPWDDASVYKTYIRRNIKLAEASSFGQTIFDYAPRSNGATDYARLAAEIFADLGLAETDEERKVEVVTGGAGENENVAVPPEPRAADTEATRPHEPAPQPGESERDSPAPPDVNRPDDVNASAQPCGSP
jgi:chromosome partitioning protein